MAVVKGERVRRRVSSVCGLPPRLHYDYWRGAQAKSCTDNESALFQHAEPCAPRTAQVDHNALSANIYHGINELNSRTEEKTTLAILVHEYLFSLNVYIHICIFATVKYFSPSFDDPQSQLP